MSQSNASHGAPLGDPNNAIDLALFGALGDLAMRKLFPALYHLDREGLMPESTRIMGLARQEHDVASFRQLVNDVLQKRLKSGEQDKQSLERFLARLDYLQLDFSSVDGYDAIRQWRKGSPRPMVVYLSVGARIYGDICRHLQASKSLDEESRVVVEKPIGSDLHSSIEINDAIGEVFPESRIYIEGRWGYFDEAGQLRDMVQNHLLQLLCLIAMDPPSNLDADAIRDEKVKVLKALKPFVGEALDRDVVRGQYIAGNSDGQSVPGYLEEEGANTQSQTETFVAMKTEVANWRWAGVPFYLRTGKRMPEKLSQIVIHFRQQPHYIFDPDQRNIASNKLIIRLQPEEGIALQVLTKDSGLDKGMRLRPGPLHLDFNSAFPKSRIPDAYERLLLEVMKGQQYLFVRRDEIEHAWRWCDQLIDGWKKRDTPPRRYPAGSWGPVASIAMITQDGRSWYEDY